MKKRSLSLITAVLLGFTLAHSQAYVQLSLNQYLEKVRLGNLEYAAQRLNMEIADAQIISASVFNNPSIGFTYYNDELNSMKMGQGVSGEISQTISPGRRKAAMNLAKSEKEMAQAVLVDYFRMLREEAALTWLEAVKVRQLYQIKKESYIDQIKLLTSDSLMRGTEFLRDLDILQNKVETGILYAQLLEMEHELSELYLLVTNFCGISSTDTVFIPEKKNIWNDKNFVLSDIIEIALNNRADILALKKEIDVSKFAISVAKSERIPEFDISLGYGVNAEAKNEMAPSPRFTGLEVGLSFPIPLFNRNKGEILSAEAQKKQAEYRYVQSEIEVKSDVTSAFKYFVVTDKKLNLFKSGLVKSAKNALTQKREEYLKGDIHLIEVLDAQRSYDDVLSSFYSAIYAKSQALVKLESAIGVWDISAEAPSN